MSEDSSTYLDTNGQLKYIRIALGVLITAVGLTFAIIGGAAVDLSQTGAYPGVTAERAAFLMMGALMYSFFGLLILYAPEAERLCSWINHHYRRLRGLEEPGTDVATDGGEL